MTKRSRMSQNRAALQAAAVRIRMPGGVGGAVPRGIPLSRSILHESVNEAFGIRAGGTVLDGGRGRAWSNREDGDK